MPDGRTLVTGAGGFIGRHVVRALRAEGADALGVDNLCVAPLEPPAPDTLVRNVGALRPEDLDGVDRIVHLAAWRSVPESFTQAARYQENVSAALHLITLARACGVRRIVIGSSCEVYGVSDIVPTAENGAIVPRSPYALSKASVEMLARMHDWSGDVEITIARLFNVYGPGHRPDTVIAGFCERIATGRPVVVHGTGEQRRDFSHVGVTAAKLIRLATIDAPPPAVNVGSGRSTSVNELLEAFRGFEPAMTVEHVGGRPQEIDEFRSDNRLADATFGPLPEPALDDGIGETLEWWRAYARRG